MEIDFYTHLDADVLHGNAKLIEGNVAAVVLVGYENKIMPLS